MPNIININTTGVKELTQLSGISKTIAYRVVNHRKRHGYFTDWRELLEVREFPQNAIPRIRERAALVPIPGVSAEELRPRRLKQEHLAKTAKKTKGYTKSIRATRSPDRLKPSA
jgi:helix-hairpin-helix protein